MKPTTYSRPQRSMKTASSSSAATATAPVQMRLTMLGSLALEPVDGALQSRKH